MILAVLYSGHYTKEGSDEVKYLLLGIASRSDCVSGAFYTDVASHLEWINDVAIPELEEAFTEELPSSEPMAVPLLVSVP